jgi:hypothetical protein
VLERRGTVVDARQDVEVQIDAGMSGGRHAAEVVPALVELEGGGLCRLVRSRRERSG